MSVTIDSNNNTLNILTSDSKNISVDLNEKFRNFNANFQARYLQNMQIIDFKTLNQSINRGDSIKDGTNSITLNQLNLFEGSFTLDQLKQMTHEIINKYIKEGFINRQVFTRNKKGDDSVKQHYQGLTFHVGFDSGLGLENFLTNKPKLQYEIIDTFGKYIDPSSFRNYTKYFPDKKSITITNATFDILGYQNTSINMAKYISANKYIYNITLANKVLTNNNNNRDNDDNIKQIFVGNKKKKNITDTATKKASIIGKSLGDKLQVFLMFIKQVMESKYSSVINCISTCDEIVLLFCIILGLPCFYTSIGIEKKIKINEVLYFNIENMNSEKAKERFNNEKQLVMNGYISFIKLIEEIRTTNSPLLVSSDYKKYNFPIEFYNGLIEDLNSILIDVQNINLSPSDTDIQKINTFTQKVKLMTVNNFIRKGNNAYMIAHSAKQYTQYKPDNYLNTAYAKLNLLNMTKLNKNFQSQSFFIIGNTLLTNKSKTVVLGGNLNKKNKKYQKMKGGEYNLIEIFFDVEPIIVYTKEDEIIYPTDEDKSNVSDSIYYNKESFDANSSLLESLIDIYNHFPTEITYSIPFVDVYSEFLCIFNSVPYYEYSYLTNQMGEILQSLQPIPFENNANLSESYRINMDIPKLKSQNIQSKIRTRYPSKLYTKQTKRKEYLRSKLHKQRSTFFSNKRNNSFKQFSRSLDNNKTIPNNVTRKNKMSVIY